MEENIDHEKIKPNLKSISGRKCAVESMENIKEFNNKIVLIGCGAIGTALIPLLFKFIKFNPVNFTVIDMDSNRFNNLIKFINQGVKTYNVKLTKDNIKSILIDELKLGQDDLIIDASYEISTNYMYQLCSEYSISYTNSSVEVWKEEPSYKDIDYTFYSRIKSIEDLDKKIKLKKNNFVISLGCNPGNVNIWTLYALDRINKKTTNHEWKTYAELASKLGLRVVHVSERDSQLTSNPRKQGEYLNTWSSDSVSWYDEAFSNLEISWGTHEKRIPEKANLDLSNEYQYVINGVGCETWAYSYTPVSKNLSGMLIRHEECYTICKRLTLKDDSNKIIYKPSSYYVYRTSDSALASTQEVKDLIGEYQENTRLMTSDITEGRDELGCTLFFASGEIYWVGSLLDINEARLIYDNQFNDIINATILQVVAGYIGSIFYLIESIEKKVYRGFMTPEDMPVDKFIQWTKPLLGPFGVIKVRDWTVESQDKQNPWQFSDFLVE
jgi:homospermidine synthase